jgi:tetratricopeptide (TPR) repeat protein
MRRSSSVPILLRPAPSAGEILFEHVHFDWEGNYRLARLMARAASTALFAQAPGDAGWLDRDACAAALAYTPHERLPMLLRIDVLVRKPPFTNQITHVADEARLAREIEAATRDRTDAAAMETEAAAAARAASGDPGNAALAGILEGLDLDRGDASAALAQARRAAGLLPRDYALAADEASVLMALGRFDEAWQALSKASSGPDLDLMLPVLGQFWSRSKRFREGVGFLDRALAARSGDLRLRVARASLLRALGDRSGAEQALRSVLAEDPSIEEAQEGLVALLVEEGRADEAARVSVAAAPYQARNQANSLRAARVCEARGDLEGLVGNLRAAELGGPVTATFELTLALKLYQLRRLDEMMEHLALARSLSTHEGDAAVTDSIESLIGRMRIEWEMAAKAAAARP